MPDSPSIYRQMMRLVALACIQASTGTDELAEEVLSVMQQASIEYSDLGIDDLENLVPDLLNIDSDDSGEAVTVHHQQGWQAAYFERVV